MLDCKLYVGIEGGSSHSTCVVLNEKGLLLSTYVGKATNPWLFKSNDDWAKVIKDIVDKCLNQITKMEIKVPQSLGISMSGAESDHAIKLEKLLLKKYSDLAKTILINHDTDGAIFTATNNGGIVLISGTGSAAQLFYPPEHKNNVNMNGLVNNSESRNMLEYNKFRIGGWGYALGDEGSAYWIAHKAIKTLYDHNDRFVISKYSIHYLEKCYKEYFKISHPDDILKYFYESFDKPFIAKFCLEVVRGAKVFKDRLCLDLFERAGRDLAKHFVALIRKADMDAFSEHPEIKVVCVGSMWKDWNLLKKGFLEEITNFSREIELTKFDCCNGISGLKENKISTINATIQNCISVDDNHLNNQISFHSGSYDFRRNTYEMLHLVETAALGAAFIAALSRCNTKLPLNYEQSTKFLDKFTLYK